MAPDAKIPTLAEFSAMVPAPFKLASHLNSIDAQALRPLRSIGENAHDLAEFLNLQSQKIDLVMNYVLTLGTDGQQRLAGTKFGGSNITFLSSELIELDRLVQLRIFIEDNNCAIFCVARVCETVIFGQQHETTVEIMVIEDDDQEQLVRTSLHVQSNQLKERADQRNTIDG